MKKFLNYLKVTFSLLAISGIMLSANLHPAYAEETGHETANIDAVSGQAVRMLRTSTGVVVDGHQLNHDYVKILNVNNGNIVINDEAYTQGGVTEAWSTQEDAYVIKGTGTSANSITISPTSNKITVYLVDLEWNGQLVVAGNACDVNIVVCGSVKNLNASCFIYIQRYYGNLYIEGLTGDNDKVTTNSFIYDYFVYPSYASTRTINIKNTTMNASRFYYRTVPSSHNYYDSALNLDNVVLNNSNYVSNNIFSKINITNSYLNVLDVSATALTISDSKINNIVISSTNYNVTNSELKNITKTSASLKSNNSLINFSCPVTGVINSTNTTLNLNSATASSFSKINLENCSLFSAIKFVGTPVDQYANDLFVKKIRLRQYPNTYVWLSVDNGPEARLMTDSNGYLYPYVKIGTTRVDARLEDGKKFYADFPATTGTDNTTTNLLQIVESTPTIVSFSKPVNINVGDKLFLYVTASPGTAGKSLSYQWYKDDILMPGETRNVLTRPESITTDSGNYKCVVKEDGGSTAASGTIEVKVSKSAISNVPVISSQTADMDLIAGSNVTLIVNAVPSVNTNALFYQWYLNNIPIDCNSSRLTLNNVGPEHAGIYKCIITEENFNTTVESAPVNIAVRIPM